jgi:Predicted periplasmic lipoprotein (DUF2279)
LKFYQIIFFSLAFLTSSYAQVNPTRLRTVVVGESILFTGGLVGLGKAWYKEPKTKFHTFNDNHEWLKIDKLGHFFWAFQMARFSKPAYTWAGLPDSQAATYGAVNGIAFQMPIEILDGFSPSYGFSVGDVVANIAGPALFIGQEMAWNEVRIQPKWSWHPTRYAKERPNLLGKNFSEQWLKDYNGQTYWFSANLSSFMPQQQGIPRMLNMAVGYSIENMVAADPTKSEKMGFKPYRQFFLSPDIDFTRIQTNSDFLRGLLFLANCIKVPAPAMEIQIHSQRPRLRVKWHAIYF